MKRTLWYLFQASFVLAFLIFNYVYMDPPVQPAAMFIVGGAFALTFTWLLSKAWDLAAMLVRAIARHYSR